MQDIHFAIDPRQPLPPGAGELERSRQRSHAAAVAFQRKKAVKQKHLVSRLTSDGNISPCAKRGVQQVCSSVLDESLPSILLYTLDSQQKRDTKRGSSEGYLRKESTAEKPFAGSEPPELLSIHHQSLMQSTVLGKIPHDRFGYRHDPFMGLPPRYAAYFSILLDYHKRVVSTNSALICRIFNVVNIFNSYRIEFFTHKEFLHISMARVQMAIDERKQPHTKPSRQVLEHVGNAISLICQKLGLLAKSESVRPHNRLANFDETVLMAILLLAVCTRMIGDVASYEVHRRNLVKLVAAKGGLDQIVGYKGCIRNILRQTDSFTSLRDGDSLFPFDKATYKPVFPIHPVSPKLAHQTITLPMGFRAMAQMERLTVNVIAVLARVASAQAEQSLDDNSADLPSTSNQNDDLHSDIWEAYPCLSAPDQSDTIRLANGTEMHVQLPGLQKVIVFTLLLYCVNTFSPLRVIGIVYYECRLKLSKDIPMWLRHVQCKDRIEKTQQTAGGAYPSPETEMETNLMIWMTYVLIDSWCVEGGIVPEDGQQILGDLHDTLTALKTWDEIDRNLRLFFWNEAFLRRCQSFWLLII